MERKSGKLSLFAGSRVALTRGSNRVLAGVCAGIAQRLDADAVLVRVTAVVLFFCTFGLAVIPYAALAVALPTSEEAAAPLEVDPLSIASDRYQRVVDVRNAARQRLASFYGVRADSGHMPPQPPSAEEGQPRPALYLGTPEALDPEKLAAVRRLPLVLGLVALLTVLFVIAVNYGVSRIPWVRAEGFWPALLLVVGTTLLACFADKLTLGVRLCGLIFCLEVCLALLPFTLGICPVQALGRMGDACLVLWLMVLACFVIAVAFDRVDFLALGVGLAAVALTVSYFDLGIYERVLVFSSYSQHTTAMPLFKG